MLPLTELRRDSLSRCQVVALDGEHSYTWSEFLADIDSTRSRVVAAGSSIYALYDNDTYRFAVALFALLSEGCTVYLPGVNHNAAVEALAELSAQFIGDFPVETCWEVRPGEKPMEQKELVLGGEIVVFTSGSTGAPKAIRKRLDQIDNELLELENSFGSEIGDSRILSTVSHQHLYGLLFSLLWPLCAGRPFWRRAFIDPVLLARYAARYDSTCWVMSPGHLHRLNADMPWDELRGTVKVIFSSGGPLQAFAALEVADGLEIYPWEILGSSETGGIARRQQRRAGDPWQALPQVELGLTSENTLKVRSPFLPDDQWYETSDQAQFDSNNLFHLGKRTDRIVKLEGKRISLPEVEVELESNPWIAEAHVTTVERHRKIVAAVATLTPEGEQALTLDGQSDFNRALRRSLASRLPALAVPRAWRIVARLPRNTQGKIERQGLKRLFASQRLPAVLSEKRAQNKCCLRIWVDRGNPYFEGHFPQGAVLPGVTQIMWAESLARDYLGLEGSFEGMKTIKFKEIVRPNTILTLDLEFDEVKKCLQFRFGSDKGECSQGRLQHLAR